MKNTLVNNLLAVAVITAGMAQPVAAVPTTTISDNYIGSDDHGYGDVIGRTRDFQIEYMDVSLSGNLLSVSIETTFAGKGDDGLFSGYTAGGTGIGYGDLFLSSHWDPNGTIASQYIGDDHSNGTTWSYGFSLDDRWMAEGTTGQADGSGTLYSLNSGNNSLDTLITDINFMTGATYRNGQEVAVNTSGDVTEVYDQVIGDNTSSWNIDAVNGRVNFLIDLTGTNLLDGDEIALHWGFTCANDVIEGAYSVPEPAILGLLGIGLLGFVLTGKLRSENS